MRLDVLLTTVWVLGFVLLPCRSLTAQEQDKSTDSAAGTSQEAAADPAAATASESDSESEADAASDPLAALGQEDVEVEEVDLPEPELPAATHFGEVLSVARSDAAVQWVNLEKVLKAKEFVPGLAVDDEAIDSRAPADGKAFGVLSVRVAQGRSLGRYDYVLKSGANASPCLALREGDGPFDVRRWVVEPEGTGAEVQMLFELSADTDRAWLECALPTTVPQARVALSFAAAGEISAAQGGSSESVEDALSDTPSAPASKQEPAAGAGDAGLEDLLEDTGKAESKPAEKAAAAPAKAAAEPVPEKKPEETAPAPKKEEPKKSGADDWF